MKIASRMVLWPAALIWLGGCNMVVTQAPLFTKADSVGAPTIRSGIWNAAKPDCLFDESLPQTKWPKCAGAQPPTPDPPPWLAVPGDPPILQLSTPKTADQPAAIYIYVAFRPVKVDASGRAIALELWPVQCGPPPGNDPTEMTKSLLPGLKPRPEGGACTTDSPLALRAAAKASRAWMVPVGATHWVRDPKPGDLPAGAPANP